MKIANSLGDRLTISVPADKFDQITQAQAHQVFTKTRGIYSELEINDQEQGLIQIFSWNKGPGGMTIAGLQANFGTGPKSIIRESTVDYHFNDNEFIKISQPLGVANVALRDYLRHSAREAAKLRLHSSGLWLIKSLYAELD